MAFTFFFRDEHVLGLVVRHVGPALADEAGGRIWDAGCATGQEPYTLAIMLAEAMGQPAFGRLGIDASDLDDKGLYGPVVTGATYGLEDLDRVPPTLFQRYFEPDGPRRFRLVERVRSRVRFHRHDLLSLRPIGSGYRLVLCKNVLLHFQPAQRLGVLRMFRDALAPGGFLATEQSQRMPGELAPFFERVAEGGQLFRRLGPARATAA